MIQVIPEIHVVHVTHVIHVIHITQSTTNTRNATNTSNMNYAFNANDARNYTMCKLLNICKYFLPALCMVYCNLSTT